MELATCVHFINSLHSVLLADQQTKIVGTKGYGGKLKDKEDPRKGSLREVKQETGYYKKYRINYFEDGGITFELKDLMPVAVIDFYNGTEEEVPFGTPSFRVLFYNCYIFKGRAVSTKEMRDPWFYPIDNLPTTELPLGDEHFLHDILNCVLTKGWMRRTKDFKTVLGYQFEPANVEDLVI